MPKAFHWPFRLKICWRFTDNNLMLCFRSNTFSDNLCHGTIKIIRTKKNPVPGIAVTSLPQSQIFGGKNVSANTSSKSPTRTLETFKTLCSSQQQR